MSLKTTDVTVILHQIDEGRAVASDLLPLMYDKLRLLAAGYMQQERSGQTLQATALLVHEAFLRLLGSTTPTWENRRHFFRAAAIAMQRILVEQARRKKRVRHGGDHHRVDISNLNIIASVVAPDDDLLARDEALAQLEQQDSQKAELVRLRYFSGLNEAEAEKTLNISRATATRWCAYSNAWLFEHVRDSSDL